MEGANARLSQSNWPRRGSRPQTGTQRSSFISFFSHHVTMLMRSRRCRSLGECVRDAFNSCRVWEDCLRTVGLEMKGCVVAFVWRLDVSCLCCFNAETFTLTVPFLCVQVKQIMEEAVTKKFVHEDSSHIIALCSEYTPHTHTCTRTLVELLSGWLCAASRWRTSIDVTAPLTTRQHQWKVSNHKRANGNQFQSREAGNTGALMRGHVHVCRGAAHRMVELPLGVSHSSQASQMTHDS